MLRILEFFMLSINKTVLLGNMAHDPEFRTFPSGDRIACFTVCTSEKWKDRATGELKERTEWHKVQARERHTVDYLDRFAQKGTRVYVEGILRTRKVPSNDGGPDRYFTEIDANIVSLENRLREGEQGQGHGHVAHGFDDAVGHFHIGQRVKERAAFFAKRSVKQFKGKA